jgi:putative ABC transport system permease protein
MSWLDALRHRLGDALRGHARDRELDEEIRYHLELETRRQLSLGYSSVEARRRALERVGAPWSIAEAAREVRGTNLMEAGMQDLAYAARSLRKSRGFTTLAVATLALGIGVTTVAYSVLDTVLVRPLPYRDAGRLVLLQERTSAGKVMPPSFPNFADWRHDARGFDGIASAMFPFTSTVVVNGDPQRVSVLGVSRGFFRTLGAPLAAGREFADEENTAGGPFALMVTYEYWKSRLGGRMPLGTVTFNDKPTPIVGVAPPGFKLVGEPDFFFPHEQWAGTCRSCHNYFVVGRLARNTSVTAAQSAMTSLSDAMFEKFGASDTVAADVTVTPLQEYLVKDFRVTLAAVFMAAALVLIIACTNLMSAQLARGLTREREFAVRTALGASRGRIMVQLLLESALLSLGGAIAGLPLAWLLLRAIQVAGAGLLPRVTELSLDGRVLAFTMLLSVVTSAGIGLYPALRLSTSRPGDAIRGASRDTTANAGGRVWNLLVGFEIAVAVVLMVGSTLMVRTMRNILRNDVGFDARGVVTAMISPDSISLGELRRIGNELATAPGAEGAAWVSRYPLQWGNESGPIMRPNDVWPKFPGRAGFRVVSEDYFAVMRQPMLRGRAFNGTDVEGSTPVAIISPGIAQLLWPGENPIGKAIRTTYLDKQWLTVVGVVAEASSWDQPRGEQNEIFVPLAQASDRARGQLIAVMRAKGDPKAAIPSVRARLKSAAPGMAAKFDTIEERIARSAADRRFATMALAAFAMFAVLLAAIGIYGVMSYAVAARTHEIGVRMALGATPKGILGHVLSGAAGPVVLGTLAGAAAGWMATRFIASILYGVGRADPAAYLSGMAILGLAALGGALAPAIRSSRVDPLVAMRGE